MVSRITAFFWHGVRFLFGQISWEQPHWLRRLLGKLSRRQRLAVFLMLFIGLPVIAVGYRYFIKANQANLLATQIEAPEITPNQKKLRPKPVVFKFHYANKLNEVSVAPLNRIGKVVASGIQLKPSVPGQWRWRNDKELAFTPQKEWPAGETFSVSFEKAVFASSAKLQSYHHNFKTQPFSAAIQQAYFYQNPKDPKQLQIVATMAFNFAVDEKILNKLTTLALLTEPVQAIHFNYHYDKHKRLAYLRSENLILPKQAAVVKITLGKGIKSLHGPSQTTADISAKVTVPSANEILTVTNVAAHIARKKDNTPQQVLSIRTSIGVTHDALAKNIEVYLLPEKKIAGKMQAGWSSPGQVTREVLTRSKRLALQTSARPGKYAMQHHFVFNAPSKRYVYVIVKSNLLGNGGYTLFREYRRVIAVPMFPQELDFIHKGSLLALGGNKILNVAARGIEAVKIHIGRVKADDINHLISQTNGQFENPEFLNYYFNQYNITEGFTEIKPLNSAAPAEMQYISLDLSRYLPQSLKTEAAISPGSDHALGLFFVTIKSWDQAHEVETGKTIQKVVLITNMALLVKDNADRSHDIFVASIVDGKPVAGAAVEVIGKNGLAILSAKSDENGHVHFPALDDFKNEQAPTVYLAKQGNDLSFIPFNRYDRQLNLTRFAISGADQADAPMKLSAFLFSDRGLYRPSEAIHIGGIVKRQDWSGVLENLPLELSVLDPTGKEVERKKIKLPASGLIDYQYQTEVVSRTGPYSVNLYLRKEDKIKEFLGSTSVNIEEFQPDAMKIRAQFLPPSEKGWVSFDNLKAVVTLQNLYGTPASDRKVQGVMTLTPRVIKFNRYPEYQFLDPLNHNDKRVKYYSERLSDGRTNPKGEAQFDLPLDKFQKATYYLNFSATGYVAEGGRSVATSISTLVSPLAYMIGYKSDGALGYIKKGDDRGLDFIAISPALQKIEHKHLSLLLYRQSKRSVLTQKPDGSYTYQVQEKKALQKTVQFAIESSGSHFVLDTSKPGDYYLELQDDKKLVYSRVNYSVVGQGTQPDSEKTAELSVKLDKSSYPQGGRIELQISAPYQGSGLITIERDKVYSYRWFHTDSKQTIQSIDIPPNLAGNAYVNIAFIRDWNSPEIFMSPLSVSVTPFSIDNARHDINLVLESPKKVLPGKEMAIVYHAAKPGKMILFGVDAGVLQAANYSAPDPLGYFYRKKRLSVTTYQTLDLIMPSQKSYLSTPGSDYESDELAEGLSASKAAYNYAGSNAASEMKQMLNPFRRSVDNTVAFWSGIIDVTTKPQTYHFSVPDYFNGTLKIMAVAVDDKTLGGVSSESLVRGDFVISPNIPTFVAPGDISQISVTVANQLKGSGPDAKLQLQLNHSDNIQVIGDDHQTLMINENGERTTQFRIKANQKLGKSSLNFTVRKGSHKQNYDGSLSVRPVRVARELLRAGYNPSSAMTLSFPKLFYPDLYTLHASASSSPLVLLAGLSQYVQSYPYACTEQIVSRAIPSLMVADNKQKVIDAIAQLKSRQNYDGGFKYWPSFYRNSSEASASLYAMHFLTLAKEKGYAIDADFFAHGLDYLQNFQRSKISSLFALRQRAYALYLLARNQQVVSNGIMDLKDELTKEEFKNWRSDILTVYMAATMKLWQDEDEANKLLDGYQPISGESTQEEPFMQHRAVDAQYLDLLVNHFPERIASLPSDFMVKLIKPLQDDRYNTLSIAYIIMALSDYTRYIGSDVGLPIAIVAIGRDHQAVPATTENITGIPVAKFPYGIKEITITDPAGKPFFYNLFEIGFPRKLLAQARTAHIELYREYQSNQGSELGVVQRGDEIQVTVQIRSLDKKRHDQVAVVELLPGGFAVNRDSIDRKQYDYVDIREDRVLFFLSADPEARKISYSIKAINAGSYTVPPPYAISMYDRAVFAEGVARRIEVQGG